MTSISLNARKLNLEVPRVQGCSRNLDGGCRDGMVEHRPSQKRNASFTQPAYLGEPALARLMPRRRRQTVGRYRAEADYLVFQSAAHSGPGELSGMQQSRAEQVTSRF